jgi:integrase/recombinase XerD
LLTGLGACDERARAGDAGLFHRPAVAQKDASPNTIAAYCQTFRLLLAFAAKRTAKPPSELDIAQLDAPLIAAFLEHLEKVRGNSVSSRNNRLAAIHSLFAYMALHHPEHAASIQRVLAIPRKKTERNPRHLPHRARGRRAAGRL